MVLLIGAETFSRILDWGDRSTCVLFGDGAGAVVVKAVEVESEQDRETSGIIATHIQSDGDFHDALYVNGGPSSTGTSGVLRMEGREVFRHAVANMSAAIERVMEKAGYTRDDIDWLVPHQANIRIIEAMGKASGTFRRACYCYCGQACKYFCGLHSACSL